MRPLFSTTSLPYVPSLLLASALLAGGPTACTTPTRGTPPSATISKPESSTCGAGAIAQIGANYVLNTGDPHALSVDASGVLLNLENTTSGGGSVLASGTSAGGFSALFDLPSGTLWTAGASASTVFFASDGMLQSVPRAGGESTTLGAVDSNFTGLALDSGTIYEATLSGISSMPTTGGTMTVIHGGGSALDLLASTDGSSLYWVTGNFLGPYYVRTASLSGTFAPTTLATMPQYTAISNLVVGGGQVVIVGTAFSTGDGSTNTVSLFTVSATGGTPVAVDTVSYDASGKSPPTPSLALANGAAYYSIGAGVKKLALDGSSSTSLVAQPTSPVAAIGASPSADGAVYVAGSCVYATP